MRLSCSWRSSTKKHPAAADTDDDDSVQPKKPAFDPVKMETENILSDLIELSRAPKTASVK
jgi:hypothetical protein